MGPAGRGNGGADIARASHQAGASRRRRGRAARPASRVGTSRGGCDRQRRRGERNCGPGCRLRAGAACGPANRRCRRGPRGVAGDRPRRGAGRSRADDAGIRIRSARSRRSDRSLSRSLLRRSGRRRGRSVRGRGARPRGARAMVHLRIVRPSARRSVDRERGPARCCGAAEWPDPCCAALHEDARLGVSFLPGREGALGEDGRDYPGSPLTCFSASSIPRFERRSASLLNSRLTCSNLTTSSCAARSRART